MERVGSGSQPAVISKANVPQILSEKACWPVAEPVVSYWVAFFHFSASKARQASPVPATT